MTKNCHGEIKKQRLKKNVVLSEVQGYKLEIKIDPPQLSDLDKKKVLSIKGNDYVEETSCPDSWPEEQVY